MNFIRRLFKRSSIEDEIREESDFHLRMRAEANEQLGMPSEGARAAARRQYGNATWIQEEVRAMHVNSFIETVAQDLRYALRGFRRAPAFTLTALLAMALGIGAATAVFSVVDLILFRSLPYVQDDRLVSVGIVVTPLSPQEFMFGQNYLDWKNAGKDHTPFESLTSWSVEGSNGGTSDCDLTEAEPLRLACVRVAANFLPTLGVRPILGRNITDEEDRPNAPRVGLLSFGFWQRRFGGDVHVLEKTISIDGQEMRIIGVLPPNFEMPTLERVDIMTPQNLPIVSRSDPGYPGRQVWAFGRLKSGVTPAQAQAQLRPLFEQFVQIAPPNFRKEITLRVRSIRDRQISDVRTASWVLLSAVLAVLLIACANVANLLLARGASRQRELAVRAAIGAGRTRLIRQTLTESLLLAGIGGIAGAGLAYGFLHALISIAPEGIARLQQASIDLRVLAFTGLGSIVAGLLFGVVPAFQTPSTESLVGLRAFGHRRQHFRNILVTVQIAVSLVLLTGAGLLLRTLWNLQTVPLGFQADNRIMATVVPGREHYPNPTRRAAFYDELERRVRAIPGVIAVASADSVPPDPPLRSKPLSAIPVEGRPPLTGGTGGIVVWRLVGSGYFAALDIPILRGREFQEEDQQPGDTVTILSETLAKRLFPNEDPLGKRIALAAGPNGAVSGTWATICGIAADVKNSSPGNANDPEYYAVRKHAPDAVMNSSGTSWMSVTLIVRSILPTDGITAAIRSQIAAVDPTLPVNIETMKQETHQMTARPRFNAVLFGLFAGIGLLLAAIGLYGVMSFLVIQRTQEVGVRMAVGASRMDIMKMVLVAAGRWTIAGAVVGIAGSLFLTRSLGTLLFHIPPLDFSIIAAALAVLTATALLAAWLPARRAARVDPLQALRHD